MMFRNDFKNESINPLKIGIHDLKETIITDKDKIIYCKAESNYTRIYLLNKSFLVTKALKYVESVLPKNIFIRIHRSYLVNINYISKIKHRSTLFIGSNTELPIARRKRNIILKRLNLDNIVI